MGKMMSTQSEFPGTVITVLSTKPDDPGVAPLIVLSMGETARVMTLSEATEISKELRNKVQGSGGSDDMVVLKSGEAQWEVTVEAALRIATALDDQVIKVQVGSYRG